MLQEEIVVENIRIRLEAANKLGEESLFINQRHLITFGEVNIPIIPEYEVVTLMEMAMSRNEVYLAEFYKDLDNHRFTYIVVSPLSLGERGSDKPFGEENDIWVQYVASYLACEYEPVATYEEAQVQILAPRANNPVCIGEP